LPKLAPYSEGEAMQPELKRPKAGIPYKDMTFKQRVVFILKVIASVLTFGFAFPNVMD
jgi:hypothetical protein